MNPPNMTTVADYYHWTAVECRGDRQSGGAMWLRISHMSPQAVNLVRDCSGGDEQSPFIQKKHFLPTLHFLLSFPGHTCTSCEQAARSRETKTAMTIEVSYQSGAKTRGERPAPVRHFMWAHFIFCTCAI